MARAPAVLLMPSMLAMEHVLAMIQTPTGSTQTTRACATLTTQCIKETARCVLQTPITLIHHKRVFA